MSTYIEFVFVAKSASQKTSIWTAVASGGEPLGTVKWFGRWRCYAFFPDTNTVFEKTCLRDIAQFCEERTKDRRK